LGLRLPDKTRKAGADIRARLQRIGLLRESGHDHFNGSLAVPVFDEVGQVIEVYGRKLLDNLRAGTPKHLYLPARDAGGRGVLKIAALIASKEILMRLSEHKATALPRSHCLSTAPETTRPASAPHAEPEVFPGQYFDQESGLNYNSHRYYGPRGGRYTRSDSLGGCAPHL